jgi:hypothetical protein
MSENNKTVVKAGSTAGFLGVIPGLLGYHPKDSVVLVAFADNRSIGAMRFDFEPAAASPASVSSTMTGLVARVPGVESMVAIAYTSRTHDATLPVLEEIVASMHRAGIEAKDSLFVASDGWGSTFAEDMPIHPLDELDPSLLPAGTPVADSILDGLALPAVPEDTIEIASRAFEQIPADILLAASLVANETPIGWYENLLMTDPSEAQAVAFAILARLNERPALRDVILLTTVGGEQLGERGIDAQTAWEEGTEYPVDLAMVMWGAGPRPDLKRLERALELNRWVSAAVPDQAGTLAVCAWLSWALGRSTHAEHYADLALAAEPEHGLSEIVRSFVNSGHLPDWAFESGS